MLQPVEESMNWKEVPIGGGNGWVVSGSMTKSGKPLLAIDLHWLFESPSTFFKASVTTKQHSISG